MSRDQELSKDYAEMSRMIEQDRKNIVEGDWFLFEQTGQMPVVHSAQRLAEYQYTLEKMKNIGWTATPITLIRKR